jgi:hypothetical protein
MMMKITVVLIVCLVCCSCAPADPPICVSAKSFAAQYSYDKTSADLKYKGKPVVITGLVNSTRFSPHEVDLKTDGFYLVRAIGKDQDFSRLRKDQAITLRCNGDGTYMPITVSSCVMVSSTTPCIADKTPAANPSSPTAVHLTITPRISGRSLVISGTTNLKDGAFVSWEYDHENASQQPPKEMCIDQGSTIVKGGHYSVSVPIGKCPRGNISVWAAFQTFIKEQPQWVKDEYGPMGEKMEGPEVKLGAIKSKTVEVESVVVKP